MAAGQRARKSISQRLAGSVAKLPVFGRARELWEQNRTNISLPLNKLQKAYVGSYIILQDYAEGDFPPTFEDQQLAYEAEAAYYANIPGKERSDALEEDMRKPFWFGNAEYLQAFVRICRAFETHGVRPPQTVVEIGAGPGWASEFLAMMQYRVIATTLGSANVEQIQQRIDSLETKGIKAELRAVEAPMETIDSHLRDHGIVDADAVFVFEALHHAFDWQSTLHAVGRTLRDGGWFFICAEPNLIHTAVSYRVGKLTKTHEIGMSRRALRATLRDAGFRSSEVLHNRLDLGMRSHWIAAQK